MSSSITPTVKARLKKQLRSWLPAYNRHLLQKDLRYTGIQLTIGAHVQVRYPELCIIGNQVRIGKSCRLEHLGGIVIADGSKLEEGVVLGSSKTTYDDLPIVIGRNCLIEKGVQLKPGTIIKDGTTVSKDGSLQNRTVHALPKQPRRFFVVSTGAAGSRSIAKTLSQHPDIECKHEPNSLLIGLSTAYAYGKVSRDVVRAVLSAIYCKIERHENTVLGESDQKLGNLIPVLAELLPAARFVWIRRHAYSFTESTTFKKEWYSNKPIEKIPFVLGKLWAHHRLNGNLCKAVDDKQWEAMEPLEKNAWYWQHWNSTIEQDLSKLPLDQQLAVTLETLASSLENTLLFLNVPPFPIALSKVNVGTINRAGVNDVEENQQKVNTWCHIGLAKWYPK